MQYENTPKPWARYFAKSVDYSLFSPLISFMIWKIGYFQPHSWGFVSIISVLLWACLEGFMISYIGTTPGKALMGIRIVKNNFAYSDKICLKKSLIRSVYCWFAGLGAGIPIIGIFTMIYNYKKLTRNELTSWDKEVDSVVLYQQVPTFRYVIAILIPIFSGVIVASLH